MTDVLRTAQWNIGGGKIRDPEYVPSDVLLYDVFGPYDSDGLESIIDTLDQNKPDIVTLQETHEADNFSQTAIIAEALGLPYWVNDTYGESHIDPDYRLGQAIISKFPLSDHAFNLF